MTDLAKFYRRGAVAALFSPIRAFHLDPVAFEIEFWEGVLGAVPDHIGALRQLGHDYTQRGDYEHGPAKERIPISFARPGEQRLRMQVVEGPIRIDAILLSSSRDTRPPAEWKGE